METEGQLSLMTGRRRGEPRVGSLTGHEVGFVERTTGGASYRVSVRQGAEDGCQMEKKL